MDSSFEKNYMKEQEIRRQFDVADKHNNEEDRSSARDTYQEFKNKIMAQGDVYASIYRLYSRSRERGNECIDIDTDIEGSKAGELADAFRSYGIKKFTYSSAWSGASETAWQFIQHGWVLEGMAEIYSGDREFMSDKYIKAHGYVFSIQ